MISFNEDYYKDWRLQVLAKTDGANIHKVNGLLGRVLNCMSNYVYYCKEHRSGDQIVCKRIIVKALKGLGESESFFDMLIKE